MHSRPLQCGRRYLLKHTSRTVPAVVAEIRHRIDVATLEPQPAPSGLGLNDLGEVRLQAARPVVFDGYAKNRLTGSFILIDEGTNATVAAGMLLPPDEMVRPGDVDYFI